MGKINILDKSIFNLIAAGEVVEKPASIVKELVENSIDAGAKHINIEVKDGGVKKIRVTDDGCGIEKDDLVKAFLPHATSKIKTANDLEFIGTLGFRGEALSSIGAVSKVTMLSKVSGFDGNKIVVEGGEVVAQTPIGCSDGTSVIVEDLFYNVPARAKFLRKDRTEESDISNYVLRLILSNPDIAIKYTLNDKIVYQSNGTGLFDAIYSVYGKLASENLNYFEYKDDDYRVYGYIGNPIYSKPNRTYQTLIVNGRFVISQQISVAVSKAYENFIMRGTFPFYIINIELKNNMLDVNVHPNKLEVKFEDSNKIFGIVYSAVLNKLYDDQYIGKVATAQEEKPEMEPIRVEAIAKNEGVSFDNKASGEEIKEVTISSDDKMFKENFQTISNLLTSNKGELKVADNDLAYTLAEQLTLKQKEVMPRIEKQPELALDISNYKIIGTIFNTYIIVEQNDTMFIIDQHAAHERILFDKFMAEYEKIAISTQPLLVPYIIDVNEIEADFLNQNMEELTKLGFDVEPFGDNSFKINSVPTTLKNLNIQKFFNEVLSVINNKMVVRKSDLMHEYIAKSACRAAVKANDILFDEEIKVLLTNISGKDQVLLCPHGRPIILKVTKTDIEKWFKRLV